jgi:hypothetical protein
VPEALADEEVKPAATVAEPATAAAAPVAGSTEVVKH